MNHFVVKALMLKKRFGNSERIIKTSKNSNNGLFTIQEKYN